MEYDLFPTYEAAKSHGYEGPIDILCIFQWLFDLGFACIPSNPKKGIYGTDWMIDYYKNLEYVGFKGGGGTFKNVLINGINWALQELDEQRNKKQQSKIN